MNIIKNLTNTNYNKEDNRKIEYIVMHYVGAVSSAKNNASYFKNEYRGASAHYFVDEKDIYQVVEDKDISWHCGADKYYCNARNTNSIGIEMCCYKNNGKLDISSKVEENALELVKDLMKKYNIDANHVIRHYDVSHKICPAPFVNNINRWNNFKGKLGQAVTNISKKSVLEIAKEVIAGKWGNGADRKAKLEKAGYNATEIQNKVNELLLGEKTNAVNKKSNETIANEVIQGKWGNGETRKKKLKDAGYDYDAVQKIVNSIYRL